MLKYLSSAQIICVNVFAPSPVSWMISGYESKATNLIFKSLSLSRSRWLWEVQTSFMGCCRKYSTRSSRFLRKVDGCCGNEQGVLTLPVGHLTPEFSSKRLTYTNSMSLKMKPVVDRSLDVIVTLYEARNKLMHRWFSYIQYLWRKKKYRYFSEIIWASEHFSKAHLVDISGWTLISDFGFSLLFQVFPDNSVNIPWFKLDF